MRNIFGLVVIPALMFCATQALAVSVISVTNGEGLRGHSGHIVTVHLDNDEGVWGLEFRLTFASAVFSVTDVDSTDRSEQFDSFIWLAQPGATSVQMLFLSLTKTLPPGSGPIASFNLSIAQDALPGVYDLKLKNVELIGLDDTLPVDIIDGNFTVTVTLDSLRISPSSAGVACGQTLVYTATGFDTGGGAGPIEPEWSVNPPDLGTIDTDGLFQPSRTGTGLINAVFEIWVDQVPVTVVPGPVTTLDIDPDSLSVITHQTRQFNATGYDVCRSPLTVHPTWSVAPPERGSIGPEGLFQAQVEGPGWIFATIASVVDSAFVSVFRAEATALHLTPDETTAVIGDTVYYTATATDGFNRWGVTPLTSFTATDPLGAFLDNLFIAGSEGSWSIIGTYRFNSTVLSDTAGIVITTGPVCTRGDVNSDGAITPGDALCAFWRSILGSFQQECEGPCSDEAAEINCDGAITPGDALCIFWRSILGLWPADCDCGPPAKSSSTGDRASRVRIESVTARSGDIIRVPLLIDDPRQVDAFGLELIYSDALLEFSHVSATPATKGWTVLDGASIEPGLIRIGGFHMEALSADGLTPFAEAIFSVKEGAEGVGELDVRNLTDDLAGVPVTKGNFRVAMEPADFALHANYPNPFNPTTHIHYALPLESRKSKVEREGTLNLEPLTFHVILKVYNILGQEVRTLVNEIKEPGLYTVTWDGTDAGGNPVASGVYLYRLEAGHQALTRHMVLMK